MAALSLGRRSASTLTTGLLRYMIPRHYHRHLQTSTQTPAKVTDFAFAFEYKILRSCLLHI